jgi:hypothetical protein
MRLCFTNRTAGIALVLGLVLPVPAWAQTAPPGPHKMEIYNGARLTVRYFAGSLSPGEASSLRDLERATNEANYVADLQELKRQYAYDAQVLEAQRRVVQEQLNGVTLTTSTGFRGYGDLNDIRYLASLRFPALATGFPVGYLGAYATGYAGYAGIGLPGLYPGYGGALNRAVASAVLDDTGPVKNALAAVMARDSTSANAVAAERSLDRALATAAGSTSIRKGLGLPNRREAYGTPVAYEDTAPVVVTLKTGRRIQGTKIEETKEWIIVSYKGGKARVRPDDVAEIQEGSTGGVGPITP